MDEPRQVDQSATCGEVTDTFLRVVAAESEDVLLDSNRAPRLARGDVVSGRFAIESFAGSGGMGTVYRANDLVCGVPVALKVVGCGRADVAERFAREARLLAAFSHPSIVRYVAHGTHGAGAAFLAMEWLDGEDLSAVLLRGRLSVAESLLLFRRVCEGVAEAHALGIVHRDLKPSNLFVVTSEPGLTKVLDFGIARLDFPTASATRTGTILGTIGYMSPEQAMGETDVDARSDVFSLGCVLYECLTGSPAFSGRHAVAVLAKVLREEPSPVSARAPELGDAFDDLIRRVLSKERMGRPPDARALLCELDALPDSPRTGSARSSSSPPGLARSEQRVVSVLLGMPDPTEPDGTSAVLRSSAVADLMHRFGGEFRLLRGGAILVVLSGSAAASDQAAQAAACALALVRLLPNARFGVATGHAQTMQAIPVGAAIDRAAALLADVPAGSVAVDDVTAALLGSRFELRHALGLCLLGSGREDIEAPRLLLGKPTPCVGREKEMALLEATLAECIQDNVSRAILVVGPPGIGKTRLAREFVAKVRESGAVRVLVANPDPTSAGSPLSLGAKLIRHAAGIRESEPPEHQLNKLLSHLRDLGAKDAEHLGEFLAEIIGVRAPSPSLLLRAARNDPEVMREQSRRAFEGMLHLVAAGGPVLVVLEDLHWGDRTTLAYLDDAWRALVDRPILLLALARPGAGEGSPKPWSSALPQTVRLDGLTPKAAARLVRVVVPDADDVVVARLVELADGNAFYLEELIRRVAEGNASLPESVLSMAESRLAALPDEARRVLRAASVFGEICWDGALEALLGPAARSASWLESLSDSELLVRRPVSRLPDLLEYGFRHALLRDAAYAMLTAEDRVIAHRLAGDFLESVGVHDPGVIAEHFALGEATGRAVSWFARAARAAIDRGAVDAALELSQKGVALGASGLDRGRLLVVKGYAAAWNTRADTDSLREALALLPESCPEWWLSVSLLIWCAAAKGHPEEALPFIQLACTAAPDPELSGPCGQALQATAAGLAVMGQCELAWSFLDRFETVSRADLDIVFEAWLNAGRCQVGYASPLGGVWRLEEALAWGKDSVRALSLAGSSSGEATALYSVGSACYCLGLYAEADDACTRSIELARRANVLLMLQWAELVRAMTWVRLGRLEAAIAALVPLRASSDANVAHFAKAVVADAEYGLGRLNEAVASALSVFEGPVPTAHRWAGAPLARAYFSLGRYGDAVDVAEAALRAPVATPAYDVELLTVRAEALRSRGDHAAACDAIRQARDFVLRVAASFESEELRISFVEGVASNRRALELSSAWLAQGAS